MAIFPLGHDQPNLKIIAQAASIIKAGGLVAFPTETVYGLGANALNAQAVKRIFAAKNRPADNPVIVHVARAGDLAALVKDVPPEAKRLIRKFWPGPLTLVLWKKPVIPNEVTAGAETVAVRCPQNKIARLLIERAGVPIAAPSANLAGKPSPTTAKEVEEDLGEAVEMILDGGPCEIGLESTVLDLTNKPFQLLRPGGLPWEDVHAHLPNLAPAPTASEIENPETPKSPGMKYRHYSPQAPLILVTGSPKQVVAKMQLLVDHYHGKGFRVGVLTTEEEAGSFSKTEVVRACGNLNNLDLLAHSLFQNLREFDHQGVGVILVQGVSEVGLGLAIMNRLTKAASEIIAA